MPASCHGTKSLRMLREREAAATTGGLQPAHWMRELFLPLESEVRLPLSKVAFFIVRLLPTDLQFARGRVLDHALTQLTDAAAPD